MSFAMVIVSLLIPFILAFLLISYLWPRRGLFGRDLLLRLSLSIGVGLGLLSVLFFVQLNLIGPSRLALALELAALIVALAVAYRRNAPKAAASSTTEPASYPDSPRASSRVLLIAFLIALVSAVITFVFMSLRSPHGEWDAWAVYNMKARFFFRAGDHWIDIFSQPMYWTGTDYPLLIPTTIAALWKLIGKETLVIQSAVAMLFAFATVGVTVSSLSVLRSKNQGLLAGLMLLGTPYFLTHAADQYSDIPIGFFFLSTIALINLQPKLATGDDRFLILAGLTAGLAAWTKNEGMLFVLAIAAARFITVAPKEGLKRYLRQMRYLAAGGLPVLLVWLYLKLRFAQPNGLLSPPEGRDLSILLDPSRYKLILEFFFRESYGFGNWAVSIVPLLLLYLFIAGAKVEDRDRANVAASFIVLAIMLLGYFMIYLISPRDLAWHLQTSLNRLYSQMWPSFLFLFFMIVRAPERAAIKEEPAPVSA